MSHFKIAHLWNGAKLQYLKISIGETDYMLSYRGRLVLELLLSLQCSRRMEPVCIWL